MICYAAVTNLFEIKAVIDVPFLARGQKSRDLNLRNLWANDGTGDD